MSTSDLSRGETALASLLRDLNPELLPGHYVFCTVAEGLLEDYVDLAPLAVMSEAEGLTLVLLREVAQDTGFPCDLTLRCITLRVHSSLEAVGLTATFSQALAERGISANVIAGYYHDHLFVPDNRADDALEVLRALAGGT